MNLLLVFGASLKDVLSELYEGCAELSEIVETPKFEFEPFTMYHLLPTKIQNLGFYFWVRICKVGVGWDFLGRFFYKYFHL